VGQFYFGDLSAKWVSIQSALTRPRYVRKPTREILLVSRPELDTRPRPNGYGSVSVELYLVLPARTFGQFLHRTAEHRLDEARADALGITASFPHLSLFLTSLRQFATDPEGVLSDFSNSRNRPFKLTSAGVRPCDSSQRSNSRNCTLCLISGCLTTTEIV